MPDERGRQVHRYGRLLTAACVLALLMAGCSRAATGADEARATAAPATVAGADPPSPTAAASPAVAIDDGACEDGVCLNPGATYAAFDPGRALTHVERALMRAPGPYAGDAFDEKAAWEAVMTSAPTTARGWAEAIISQIHPDYAEDAQDVITFEATIEGVPDEPVEQVRGVDVVGSNHFSIVLDASGSMADRSDGPTRMAQAKDAIRRFVSDLPDGSTVSLRLYGQAGSNSEADKERSCASTTVVYEGGPDGLGARLGPVRPVGWTPLARAVRAAAADIPVDASDAIVYVVTDGLETCGGRPVDATRALSSAGIQPIVNVIGFHVGDTDTRQLRRMAKAGGGTYTDARSQAELEAYWREDVQAMMDAWSTWKREALHTITEQGRANMDAADRSGRAVMDAADLEWDRAQLLIDRMEADESIGYDIRRGTWGELYDRHRAIWGWGYDNKRANWGEAYDQKRIAWGAAYDLGRTKWSQYYRKKRSR